MFRLQRLVLIALFLLCHAENGFSQSVESREEDNSVEAELASFNLAEGYEIQLFADESDGIANPVCIRWDAAGRLWALCTWAYPQLEPSVIPDDKILILEDTDGDGRADRTTTYADGLNMPTGFAFGDGGVYVAQGTDLLHFQDTDNDDQADAHHVVFTGFGTGDTHQFINSLTWSPDGDLFFCQGLHIFSRVETPWGIVRADEGGFWRLRTKEHRLTPFTMSNLCSVNPWGICWTRWGEMLVKANDPYLTYTSPAMIEGGKPVRLRRAYGDVCQTPGKSMAIEVVENSHLPDALQGHGLIAGYFAHNIVTVPLVESGAGLAEVPSEIFLHSTHNSFRPVEIRIGPEGAIYVADWFNPIIGHYQASFRHPDRDYTHGRIWRITATGQPLVEPPCLMEMTTDQLCRQLESTERWNREHSRRLLVGKEREEVIAAVASWVNQLDKEDPAYDHHLYEAICVLVAHEQVDLPLLEQLMQASAPGARAFAARIIGRWQDRLDSPLEMLNTLAVDQHPRVRLEAVVACSTIPSAESVVVASRASRLPVDRFLEYSLSQTIHALSPHWLPALEAGSLAFDHPDDLIYTLNSFGGASVASRARSLLRRGQADDDSRDQLLALLARVGNADDMQYVFEQSADDANRMGALVEACQTRNQPPSGNVHASLARMLGSIDPKMRAAAARLAGLWNYSEHAEAVAVLVDNPDEQADVRAAAYLSLGELSPTESLARFDNLLTPENPPLVRLAVVESAAQLDLDRAMAGTLALIDQTSESADVASLFVPLMQRRGSVESLIGALQTREVSADTAKLISRWVSAVGYDNATLTGVLNEALGLENSETVEYSAEFVADLLREVAESGDPAAGQAVFASSLTNCAACHRSPTSEQGPHHFFLGPDLSVVGAGLEAELIVESIVWPSRQLKEGYESATLFLDDGRMLSGYILHESDATVILRELSTGDVMELAAASIEERAARGTVMPAGFTSALTRQELRDLVAYLTSLKGGTDAAESLPDS